MTKRTGGCAFPNDGMWANGNPECGMMLRDYFAAHALVGLCGNEAVLKAMAASTDKSGVCARANAMMAYELADAMLTERGAE